MAQKNLVATEYYTCTKSDDVNVNLKIALHNCIKNATIKGIPSIFDFAITKNNNISRTDRNEVVRVILPILPATYNYSSDEAIAAFLKDSKDSAVSEKKAQELTNQALDTICEAQMQILFTFIKYQIANKLYDYVKLKDKKSATHLKNLDIMKDFDLSLHHKIKLRPKKVITILSQSDEQEHQYFLEYSNGKKLQITKEQFQNLEKYIKFYNDASYSNSIINRDFEIIDGYENYISFYEQNNQGPQPQ